MKNLSELKIPENFDFKSVSGLSNEVVEKLNHHKPPTIFAASQISGITPAALDILQIYIKMQKKKLKCLLFIFIYFSFTFWRPWNLPIWVFSSLGAFCFYFSIGRF